MERKKKMNKYNDVDDSDDLKRKGATEEDEDEYDDEEAGESEEYEDDEEYGEESDAKEKNSFASAQKSTFKKFDSKK